MRWAARAWRWWTLAIAAGLIACTPAPPAPPAPPPSPAASVSTSARAPRAPREAPAPGRVDAGAATTPAPPARLDDIATASDTFDSLKQRYGARLRQTTLPGAEGAEVAGWVLYPDDPRRRIEIYPTDDGRHPGMLMIRDVSEWVRSDGLRLGLDTRALETMNGGAFQFVGLDWDYGGVIDDWKGGRLANGGRFLGPVQLCTPPDAPDGYPTGDAEFPSDLPVVRAHPAKVCVLGVAVAPVTAGESASTAR